MELENSTANQTEAVENESLPDDSAAEEASAQTAAETQPDVNEEIAIPENWEASIKDFFNSDLLKKDLGGRKAFFDKFKSLDDGFNTKFQDLTKKKKDFEGQLNGFKEKERFLNGYLDLESAIPAESRTALLSKFGSMPAYLSTLVEWDKAFSSDPLAATLHIMKGMGITPEMLVKGADSPEYKAKTQEKQYLNQLERAKAEIRAETEAKFRQDAFAKEVHAFASATDASGKPAHPHLATVSTLMDSLSQTNPSASLDELYTQACYAHPQVRQQLLNEQIAAASSAKTSAAEIAKAKAAQGVKASPKAGTSPVKSSEQVLNDLLDEEFGTAG